jgi:leucyl aminopeptidase (aminopeptidase T)
MSIAHARGNAEVTPLLAETFYAVLPIGRAYLTPQIDSVQGEILLDSVAGARGTVTPNIYLKVVDGRIKLIKDGKATDALRQQLRLQGANAHHVMEISFKMNDKARLGNSAFEDEKVLGMRTRFWPHAKQRQIRRFCQRHLQAPTVTIDGKKIIEQGKVLVV